MVWTKLGLQDFAKSALSRYSFIVVSNREPYIHRFRGGRIECVQPASGMVTALDPLLRACGGTWVAHGGGQADKEVCDENGRVPVPPSDPRYTLRRVWLTKEQERGYYYGLSNGGLWPLCHVVFRRPVFDPRDWETYKQVNELFAQAVLEEAGDAPTFVFIQDYHFSLLPQMLKNENPNLVVAQFWHIPWPNRETFRVFPWKQELLDGLLGNDLLGFHLQYHCANFLDTVERELESKVDLETHEITRHGKVTRVRPYPIGIDFENHTAIAAEREVEEQIAWWRSEIGLRDESLGLGIDRIDYTKGIPDRLRAIDHFLERHAEFRGKTVFLQIGVPSRTRIPEYQRLGEEIENLVEEVNWKWSEGSWRPVIYRREQLGSVQMMALHRLANWCMISSLHDGMNLVAKEFIASRYDEDGVLILSTFTGASRELTDALLVNPFDVDECAEAIYSSLVMPAEERRRRMQRMRAVVAKNNIYRWAARVLSSLLKFEFPQTFEAEDSEERGVWVVSENS